MVQLRYRTLWLVAAIASALFCGVAIAAAAGTASRWVNNALVFDGSSGNDAVAFDVNGLRLHLGTGSGDYFDSDGTDIAAHTKVGLTFNSTTCTLNGASPATCTATVTASASCTATVQGTTQADATSGVAMSLSGTTLTVTSGNGHTNVVNIICDR